MSLTEHKQHSDNSAPGLAPPPRQGDLPEGGPRHPAHPVYSHFIPKSPDNLPNNTTTSSSDAAEVAADQVETYDEFDSMGLKSELLRGIYSLGYERPSPIQQKGIVASLSGRDVICQAQSGTGKTATFGTAILERIDEGVQETQALVLSPTRELAKQTHEVITGLATYFDDRIQAQLCVGGTSMASNAQGLRKKPQIVVGTPGRCLDFIQRGSLQCEGVRILVLDEMDVLLSSGFRDTIYEIFSSLPGSVQVILVSATMPPEALEITHKFMRNPIRILVKKESIALSGIRQFYIDLEVEENKFDTLCDLYESISVSLSVIFVNTVRKAQWLGARLEQQNFSVGVIHRDMSTEERNEVVRQFKDGIKKVLVATDILARGIDVQGVGVVVNYDLPLDQSNYIHRVGRCGRYGRKGIAINFVTHGDVRALREIEQFYHTDIQELPASIDSFL